MQKVSETFQAHPKNVLLCLSLIMSSYFFYESHLQSSCLTSESWLISEDSSQPIFPYDPSYRSFGPANANDAQMPTNAYRPRHFWYHFGHSWASLQACVSGFSRHLKIVLKIPIYDHCKTSVKIVFHSRKMYFLMFPK